MTKMYNIAANFPEWTSYIFSIIIGLATVITSYIVNKSKQKTDDFSKLMSESSNLRKEIREEMERRAKENLNEIKELEIKYQEIKSHAEIVSEELSAVQHRFNTTINKLPYPIAVIESNKIFIVTNDAWHTQIKIPPFRFWDSWRAKLSVDNDIKEIEKIVNEGIYNNSSFQFEVSIKYDEDMNKEYLISCTPVLDPVSGIATRWVCIAINPNYE